MDANNQAPATDDQELAKVLESMNTTVSALPTVPPVDPAADTSDTTSGLQFEETAPAFVTDSATPAPVTDPEPALFSAPAATPAPVGDLETIKRDALQELRPLVDKLNLAPEEKFDTLLLIIRSTDDRSLVAAAHAAAKSIEDEGKKAEALLEVIKEIDYFSHPAQ